MKKIKIITVFILCLIMCAGCGVFLGKLSWPKVLTEGNDKVEHNEMCIISDDFSVTINVKKGIELTSVYDKKLEHEYISIPNGLFDFTLDEKTYSSQKDLTVLGTKKDEEGFHIRAKSEEAEVTFNLVIKPDPNAAAILMECYVSNDSKETKYIVMTYPEILPVNIPGNKADICAAIPQEGGWVSAYDSNSVLGFSPVVATAPTKNAEDASGGLPTCINAMEVLSVYNKKGEGGLFIANADGEMGTDIAPIHMIVNHQLLQGHCVAQLEKGKYCQLSTIAFGAIREGDWHEAVDYYTAKHSNTIEYPDIPTWLRDAGAIYSANNGGVGGNYLLLPETQSLYQRMNGNFENMPDLLTKANKMGTNVILVVDWYDKANITSEDKIETSKLGSVTSPYYNKGDYIPRTDMGGEEAFKAGVKALHEAGGKIIVYVEPFVVLQYSEIGREKGELWAARNPLGELDTTYADACSYSMSCAVEEWREYLVDVCVRLVEEYGVDGIYFDSMGNQWNHSYYTNIQKKTSTIQEYNQGFIAMCQETREAIKKVNPDAVLLCEAGASTAKYTDGGFSGDFLWGKTVSDPRILASPVRYGMPEANLYINGSTLSELKQCYAAGYNMALSYYWEGNQAYIRKLVELRQNYKDALIYGEQEYQPETTNSSVVAYSYRGNKNTVITALNLSTTVYNGTLSLSKEYADTKWINELTSETYNVGADGKLHVSMGVEELMVLKKID